MSALSSVVMTEVDTNLRQWLNELESKKDPNAKVVDFEPVWKWAGYSQKGHAKTALDNQLVVGRDFCLSKVRKTNSSGKGTHTETVIMLTIAAAEEFLMQAPTEQGKAVRHYFIQCEKKWRLLKTNVDNGRVRLEDKVTGEVVDNPLKDAEYLENRYDAAVANTQKNDTINKKFPKEGIPFYIEMNGMISEAVLGKRPRQFLVDNNLIQKQKNKKGNMVYPSHPNGRDIMTKAQLGVVTGLEAVAAAIIQKEQTSVAALETFRKKHSMAMQVFEDLHGDHISKPTMLEDVKTEYKSAVICAPVV